MADRRMKVGVVGLGSMGLGMARSLVRAGHEVHGCDVRPEPLAALREAGGTPAASPAELAGRVEALVVVVVNAAQTDQVLFGGDGAAPALPRGAVVMTSATVAPEYAAALGDRLAALGLLHLDAPISGGAARAAKGELSVMASGSPAAFDRAGPVLAAVAATVHRLGERSGQGSKVKMVNQLLAGVHIAAAAEAMALCIRAGADPQAVYDVICGSAGASWMFQNRVPHMLEGDYAPKSAVEIFVKDLGVVLDSGRELRFPLPLAAAAHQLFLATAGAGHGSEDDAAVVKVYEALTGIKVGKAG